MFQRKLPTPLEIPPITLTSTQKVRPGTFERAIEKAVICVSSKFELATVTSLRMREEAARKEKAKGPREKKESPPKVPAAVATAPEYLFLLPWKKQIPFLDPAEARALRERMEREGSPLSRMMRAEAEAEAQRGRRG